MIRPLLLGSVLLLGAGCRAPAPRIPFKHANWHAFALSGTRSTTDRYIGSLPVVGVEYTLHEPGTSGWAWDVGLRYGSDDGTDTYFERRPNPDVVVDVERESDYYEFALGVRQIFRPDGALQPYVGVGGSLLKSDNVDNYPETTVGATTYPARQDHFHKVSAGIYARTGVLWNVLRDQLGKETEVVIGLDVRGVYGDDLSWVEVVLALGFGK